MEVERKQKKYNIQYNTTDIKYNTTDIKHYILILYQTCNKPAKYHVEIELTLKYRRDGMKAPTVGTRRFTLSYHLVDMKLFVFIFKSF